MAAIRRERVIPSAHGSSTSFPSSRWHGPRAWPGHRSRLPRRAEVGDAQLLATRRSRPRHGCGTVARHARAGSFGRHGLGLRERRGDLPGSLHSLARLRFHDDGRLRRIGGADDPHLSGHGQLGRHGLAPRPSARGALCNGLRRVRRRVREARSPSRRVQGLRRGLSRDGAGRASPELTRFVLVWPRGAPTRSGSWPPRLDRGRCSRWAWSQRDGRWRGGLSRACPRLH